MCQTNLADGGYEDLGMVAESDTVSEGEGWSVLVGSTRSLLWGTGSSVGSHMCAGRNKRPNIQPIGD